MISTLQLPAGVHVAGLQGEVVPEHEAGGGEEVHQLPDHGGQLQLYSDQLGGHWQLYGDQLGGH